MESNMIFVAVTQTGAACLGARSPWTTLAAVGANHALWQNPALAAGGSDARRAFQPNPAPMTAAGPDKCRAAADCPSHP